MKFLVTLFLLLPLMANADLTGESQVSTVTSGGNSNVETYLFRTSNQLKNDLILYRLGGHYTYGEADNNVSARDWDINTRYQYMFTEKLANYFGVTVEGFRFRGIKARYNFDIGLVYYYIQSDDRNFFSEAGYRYTIEDRYGALVTQSEHKGRLYTEYREKVTKNFQYNLWAEYIPNFTNTEDYIINFEVSATTIINSYFSLKVAYQGFYDDDPAIVGNENYDYTYTTSLVAKF